MIVRTVSACFWIWTNNGGCVSESWHHLRTVKLENCETLNNGLGYGNLITVLML